jgi:hypothetical protein
VLINKVYGLILSEHLRVLMLTAVADRSVCIYYAVTFFPEHWKIQENQEEKACLKGFRKQERKFRKDKAKV